MYLIVPMFNVQCSMLPASSHPPRPSTSPIHHRVDLRIVSHSNCCSADWCTYLH
ncbi:hypothetical protein BofuT4_P105040.1 [Botrytis cinerea T4]|uniref:Uncharacterized protein n=1 Tax=Botryotinia fuckeliana (strain T4) TaxID=999810 RepID=G2YAC0_BOTF4|nr:hypothetical protein BofuT4_P105040.1 [Botrytis cinerea T4]